MPLFPFGIEVIQTISLVESINYPGSKVYPLYCGREHRRKIDYWALQLPFPEKARLTLIWFNQSFCSHLLFLFSLTCLLFYSVQFNFLIFLCNTSEVNVITIRRTCVKEDLHLHLLIVNFTVLMHLKWPYLHDCCFKKYQWHLIPPMRINQLLLQSPWWLHACPCPLQKGQNLQKMKNGLGMGKTIYSWDVLWFNILHKNVIFMLIHSQNALLGTPVHFSFMQLSNQIIIWQQCRK